MHHMIHHWCNLVQPRVGLISEIARAHNQSIKNSARKYGKTLGDDVSSAIKRFKEIAVEGIDHQSHNSPSWVIQ